MSPLPKANNRGANRAEIYKVAPAALSQDWLWECNRSELEAATPMKWRHADLKPVRAFLVAEAKAGRYCPAFDL